MSYEQDKEVYLGDGLYASFDGYAIRLRAPRIDGIISYFWSQTFIKI